MIEIKTPLTSIEGVVRISKYSYGHSERSVKGRIEKESSIVTSLTINPYGEDPIDVQFNGYVGTELEGINVAYQYRAIVQQRILQRLWRNKLEKEEVITQEIKPLQAGYPTYQSVRRSISLE